MIQFGIKDFLSANAQEYAKLIGDQYTFGGIGSNPSGRLLIEQYRTNLGAWGGSGGDMNMIFQPGTPAFLGSNPSEDRAFLGNAYISILPAGVIPAEYSFYVNMVGVSMGSESSGEGLISTDMNIFNSTNVANPFVAGELVLIEVPKVPFMWLQLHMAAVGATINWEISAAFMGLQIKK